MLLPLFIAVRIDAGLLGRRVAHSILTEPHSWRHGCGGDVLYSAVANVMTSPKLFRVFDSVHLSIGGVEVWLPLLSRLRLRNAVRYWKTEHARQAWNGELVDG